MKRWTLLTLTWMTLFSASACGGAAAPGAGGPGAADGPKSALGQGARRDVDVYALRDDRQAGKVAALLDVRTPGEFAQGHVPGAKNVPLSELGALVQTGALPKDQELYLICEVGGRSDQAAKSLASQGFQVVNVDGGTAAWRKAGLPLE